MDEDGGLTGLVDLPLWAAKACSSGMRRGGSDVWPRDLAVGGRTIPKTVSSSRSIEGTAAVCGGRLISIGDTFLAAFDLGIFEEVVAIFRACRGGDFPAKVGKGLVDAM